MDVKALLQGAPVLCSDQVGELSPTADEVEAVCLADGPCTDNEYGW